VSANQILQNFLSVENFPEWKWAFIQRMEMHDPTFDGMNYHNYLVV
jgi:hypothetical protein